MAEKLLKAFLVSTNVDFGRTHDLEFLLQLCRKYDHGFEELDVGNPSFYAVEVRYPDEFYVPSVDEAKECFPVASDIKDFVFKKLGMKDQDLRQE